MAADIVFEQGDSIKLEARAARMLAEKLAANSGLNAAAAELAGAAALECFEHEAGGLN